MRMRHKTGPPDMCSFRLLVAAMVLAAASGGVQATSPLAAPKPPPCAFVQENNFSSPYCKSNPEWVKATLSNTVGKKGSLFARLDVMIYTYEERCGRYDTSSQEGRDGCRADRANRCFLAPRPRTCVTSYDMKVQNDILCDGSKGKEILKCLAKYRDECGLNGDNCTWSELFYFSGIEGYNRSHKIVQDIVGGPLYFGACYHKDWVAAAIMPDGSYNATSFREWSMAINGNATNITSWQSVYGNCTTMELVRKGSAMAVSCNAYNTMSIFNNSGIFLNISDYNAVRGCVSSGCEVAWVNTNKFVRNLNITDPQPLFECHYNSELAVDLYNPNTDKMLLRQGAMCSLPTFQYDEEACTNPAVAAWL